MFGTQPPRHGHNIIGSIMRTMIMQPRVLLMDKPTARIQPNIIQQIGRVIDHLKSKGDLATALVAPYFDFANGWPTNFMGCAEMPWHCTARGISSTKKRCGQKCRFSLNSVHQAGRKRHRRGYAGSTAHVPANTPPPRAASRAS